MNAGEIKGFDVKPFLDVANTLLASDEFERAIWVLENLPAYYRDHTPQEVLDLKNHARSQWMSIDDYVLNPHDMIFDVPRAVSVVNATVRGKAIKECIEEYNKKDITPHLVDMGPGEFWLPIGLKEIGLKFTYYGYSVQKKQEAKVREYLGTIWQDVSPDKNVIFNACEIIEHLTNPKYDILQLFNRKAPKAETIFLSTPLYTFGGGNWEWAKKENQGFLGHLRAYTPREFMVAVSDMFPTYSLEFVANEIMMVKGKIKGVI